MENTNVLRVQQLVDKINSCNNPREARSWLHNLRGAVKEVGFGKLPEDLAISVYNIEKVRGSSDKKSKRAKRMEAFVNGFDGKSNDYFTLVDGIKSNLYGSQDVSRVFNNQIEASLSNCAQDNFDSLTHWNGPQSYFAGLVSQGLVSQDRVDEAISKQNLRKLEKGFGYDVSKILKGLNEGQLDPVKVAQLALTTLSIKDQVAARSLYESSEFQRLGDGNEYDLGLSVILGVGKPFNPENKVCLEKILESNSNLPDRLFRGINYISDYSKNAPNFYFDSLSHSKKKD